MLEQIQDTPGGSAGLAGAVAEQLRSIVEQLGGAQPGSGGLPEPIK